MLLIFLLCSIITGLILIVSALALFVTVYFGQNNGLSWAMAFVTLEIGLAFVGLPLTIINQDLMLIGIVSFVHLWLTFGYFGYNLWTSRKE